MQLLQDAREKMGLPQTEAGAESTGSADDDRPKTGIQRTAARCWALLLVRIYECLPLLCPQCGEPMRIIAFVLDPPVIERILDHIGEPSTPPMILPARSPPQGEMDFDQVSGCDHWAEMDQTAGTDDDAWD